MPSNPRIRASDADRDRTAALLREHHAAGRLTIEEFNERLEAVYAAKTLGELDELLADLPAIDLYELPDAPLRRGRGGGVRGGGGGRGDGGSPPLPWTMAMSPAGRFSPGWRAAWGGWLSVSMITFLIWLLTGRYGDPWFLWVMGPWGLLLLSRWITGGPPRRRGRYRRC